ncbi:MAG: M23 family metallopeptidase, partial [Caldilineaceae bacterium]
MLRHMPFIGNFPISQAFGANAGAAPGEAGPPIGHNGLDFAMTIGTPVAAVQNGAVLAAGTDPAGYGEYVVLGHEWGQSLYAHLHETHVVQGQQVQAGDQLGLSGNSGLSNAPHLHFGLRIHPFSVEDGWSGYSDPEPYLRRLTQGRGAL